jgi:tetratricopeptide (TPR) repeat protein
MLRKNHFTFLLTVALFITGGIAVFAQTAPVMGRIVMKKADGTTAPVADAVIDVYRIDIKGKLPSSKTNSKGEFSFAGFPISGQYMFAVSAPNAKAEIVPGVKAGDEKVVITLVEGDGVRLTEDQARGAMNAAPTSAQSGELTAEQKKAQADYEKQVAEINAKNAKSKESDELIRKVLEEGSVAYKAKNYDLAVAKFDEGYKASPDFVGSAPVLLNNKAVSLRFRGIDMYNQSTKLTDATAKIQNMNKVSKDFADAIDAYNQSLIVLKNAPATDITDRKIYDAVKMDTLRGAKELAKNMVTTEKIDATKTGVIKTLIEEYVAVETDKAAKAEAQVVIADVYRIAGDPDNAIVEYRKALETSPDNPDALAGLGLSLFDAGERSSNTQQKQEGLNYMQRFAEVAPNTHKLKESVAGAVEYLKSQKLTPQKNTKKKN